MVYRMGHGRRINKFVIKSLFIVTYRSYHYAIHHSGSRGSSGPFDVVPNIKRVFSSQVELLTFISFHFIYCRVRHRWAYDITPAQR